MAAPGEISDWSWHEGDILGPAYSVCQIPVTDKYDRDATATVVYRPADGEAKAALVYVHGWCDYFFHDHVAEYYTSRGVSMYGLDLRRYGRSLMPGQLANFVDDLSDYFEEFDAVVQIARVQHGHQHVILMGHSTGGLVAALWAHDRRNTGWIDALVLNSPWLDLAGSDFIRKTGTRVIDVLGKIRPTQAIPLPMPETYGHALHADVNGEWNYDTRLKPHIAPPVRLGWVRAVRQGHKKLHAGLSTEVPALVMHAARGRFMKEWSPEANEVDTVLDVRQIARWAPNVGKNVEAVAFDKGVHDLFLSARPVREQVFDTLDRWLRRNVPVLSGMEARRRGEVDDVVQAVDSPGGTRLPPERPA